jgi:hypothetical protein
LQGINFSIFLNKFYQHTLFLLFILTYQFFHLYSVWPLYREGYLGGLHGDGGLYIWLTKFGLDSFFNHFTTPAFYPYGYSLGWSDNFLLPSALSKLFTNLNVPFVILYNSIFVIALLLTSYCSFRLAFYLNKSYRSAWIVGTTFLTLPFLQEHSGHPQLMYFFWIPLGIEFFFRGLNTRKNIFFFLAALSISGAFFTAVYYAVFLAFTIVILLFLLIDKILKERDKFKVFVNTFYFLLGIIPTLLVIPNYLPVKNFFGGRGLHESYIFSASILSFFSAPPNNFLNGYTAKYTHSEAWFFSSFTVLSLLLFYLLKTINKDILAKFKLPIALSLLVILTSLFKECYPDRLFTNIVLAFFSWSFLVLGFLFNFTRKTTPYFNSYKLFFIAFTTFIVALGPLGNPFYHQKAFGFTAFLQQLPGFDGIRAISRIGLLTVFFLVIFASRGISFLPKLVFPIVLIFICIENYQPSFAFEKVDLSNPFQEVKLKQGALIILPMVTFLTEKGEVKSWSEYSAKSVEYMNIFSSFKNPLVNGYSGQRTKLMVKLPNLLRNFPDEESLFYLRRIGGLRYIVLIGRYFSPESYKVIEQNLVKFKKDLKILSKSVGGDYLLKLKGVNGHRHKNNGSLEFRVPSYHSFKLHFKAKGKGDLHYWLLNEEREVFLTKKVKLTNKIQMYEIEIDPNKENLIEPYLLRFDLPPKASFKIISF